MGTASPDKSSNRWFDRRARGWDRLVTAAIVLFLLVPYPFVRVKTWPGSTMLAQHPIVPWSEFRICYLSHPDREPVEEVFRFTWTGKIISESGSSHDPLIFSAAEEPLMKWQNRKETRLTDAFQRGDFVYVESFWQPIIAWPFRMAWGAWADQRDSAHGGAAN